MEAVTSNNTNLREAFQNADVDSIIGDFNADPKEIGVKAFSQKPSGDASEPDKEKEVERTEEHGETETLKDGESKEEEPKPDEQKEESKTDKREEKKVKEAERLNKTWKSYQEERAKFDEERKRFDSERQELERLEKRVLNSHKMFESEINELRLFRESFDKGRPDYIKLEPSKFIESAEHYEQLAEKAMEDGDIDLARQHKAKARQDKDYARQLQSELAVFEEKQKLAEQETLRKKQFYAEKVIAQKPELKDANHPLTKRVVDVLSGGYEYNGQKFATDAFSPILQKHEMGLPMAVRLAELTLLENESSSKIQALEEKLKELEAQNKKLTAKTALGTSQNTRAKGEKPVSEMSEDEKRAHFRQQFANMEL